MLLLLGILCAASSAALAGEALVIEPGRAYRNLARHAEVLRDATQGLTARDIVDRGKAAQFQPVDLPRLNFGFTDDKIWLRFRLVNGGADAADLRLAFNVRFMTTVEAYLVDGSGVRPLMTNREEESFAARPVPHRHLVAPFGLGPGEAVTLLVGYTSGGATALPLSIETELSWLDRGANETIKNTIFYTAAALMIFFSLVFTTVNRWQVHVAYAVYFGWVTFYIMHMDGYTFQYVWPEHGEWNALASLPLGLGMNLFAAIFARVFLQSRTRHPGVDKVLLTVIGLTAAAIALSPLDEAVPLKKYAFPYTLLCSLVFLGCAVGAARTGLPGSRFFVLGWIGIVSSAVLANWAHWFVAPIAVNASFDVMRAGILIEAAMLALAIMDQLNQVRRQRDGAMRREMRAYEGKLAAERMQFEALALADARGQRLAAASHDLKQPLMSLRLQLQRSIADQQTSVAQSIRQTLGYLDDLVRQYLEETADRKSAPLARQDGWRNSHEEGIPISLVIDSVRDMFAAEAQTKGVTVVAVPCSAQVAVVPMVAMRILSNFVANAVKYARQERVLIGCRRNGTRIRVEVHDQGPGIEPDRLRRLLTGRAQPGDVTPGGNGLGIGIACELSADHGIELTARSRPGIGSVFAICLPMVAEPPHVPATPLPPGSVLTA
ncbi:sensor histidine kinase [Desertibaculum subflavum]|uniref:sensor histidine kinase n=1 Tax=Desertibaculum subflavum TaxID=2268458 RepID=UPI0013C42EF6